MKIKKRSYHIKGLTRILGAQAANPAVRSEFIASKAASLAKGEEETAMLPQENLDTKNLTVFLRDDGALCLADYVIKGFLKEALKAIKSQVGIAQTDSKVDNFVLIEPAYLKFYRDGELTLAPDGVLERPLRAVTMQGPRVSVTASEVLYAGWELEFDVLLLDNPATPKSRALSFEAIDQAMEYGAFKGLGQWRNGQNGRFTYAASEIVELDGI